MSDEHNKPENSAVSKPRRTRRPAAEKAADVGSAPEQTATKASLTQKAPAEKAPAAASTAKPSRARTPRKSATTSTTEAGTGGENATATQKAASRPARPAPKTAPAKKVAATAAESSAAAPATKESSTLGTVVTTDIEAKKPRNTRTARKPAPVKSAPVTSDAPSSLASPAAPTSPISQVAAVSQISSASPASSAPSALPADKASPTRAHPADNVNMASPTESESKPPRPRGRSRNAAKGTAAPARPASVKTHTDATNDTSPAQPTAEDTTSAPRPRRDAPAQSVPRVQVEDTADTTLATSAEGDAPDAEGDAPARKNRRGRRGGRGRSRKGRQAAPDAGQDADQDADGEAFPLEAAQNTEDNDFSQDNYNDTAADYDDSEAGYASDASDTASETPARGRTAKKESGRRGAKVKEKEVELDSKPGRRKMFISVVPGEQVEVALVEEGVIGEYYLDMLNQAKTKGNIYKGVVHNVDANLQAAFVSYGAHKNGFLQIDEIHSEYYLAHHEAAKGKKFPPIQKVIKPGQEVLVQVVKEPTGNKGAFLTTWLSLAGRFLVLTPGQEQIGVSRKVDNDEERSRLREMMNGIEPGEGLGVIVRTVSAGTSKTTLKNDLQYLKRVWKEIRRRGTSETAPSLVYQESSLAERAVRDYLTEDVCEVWVDNESVAESLRETVALLFPRKEDLVRVHADVRQTLWERFNIQRQLEQIYSREVTLPSGGRLVFDQTEALMAVDINSGKISGKANFESMALKTNIEAAEAIARHLKLRDIGGQVVIDFIEMRDKSHVREVEKTLRNAMKNDRARHDVARMSSFGLLEIVRQRTGSSALAVTMEPCPCCHGTGIRRNMEWQSLQALRQIGRQARTPGTTRCVFESNAELGMYLLNHKRDRLREMEQQTNIPIEIRIQP